MHVDDPLRDVTFGLLVTWFQDLPESIRTNIEGEMKFNWKAAVARWERDVLGRAKAEGEAKGKAEGEAKGKAEAVVTVLESRGLPITEAQRKKILGCTDVKQLDLLLRGAIATSSVSVLLAKRVQSRSPQRQPTRRATA